MRLNHSAASPYVRKVMACAIARGLDRRIEKVDNQSARIAAGAPGREPAVQGAGACCSMTGRRSSTAR